MSWLCVSVLRIFIMRTIAASTWYWRSWNTRSVVLTFSSCYSHIHTHARWSCFYNWNHRSIMFVMQICRQHPRVSSSVMNWSFNLLQFVFSICSTWTPITFPPERCKVSQSVCLHVRVCPLAYLNKKLRYRTGYGIVLFNVPLDTL